MKREDVDRVVTIAGHISELEDIERFLQTTSVYTLEMKLSTGYVRRLDNYAVNLINPTLTKVISDELNKLKKQLEAL